MSEKCFKIMENALQV